MTVHIADLLGLRIDLITRGMPLPMTAERRLFADGLEHEAFDDEDDEDETIAIRVETTTAPISWSSSPRANAGGSDPGFGGPGHTRSC